MPDKIPVFGQRTEKERHRRFKSERADRKQNDFYSGRTWRKLRASKLAQDPLCIECDSQGITTPATVVDHIQEVKEHPKLAYDMDNLRSLCQSCHNRKTQKTRRWTSRAG